MTQSLYVHIPFCKHICSYCDFCKVYYKEDWVDLYLDELEKEIKGKDLMDPLHTLYIGGGTPTALCYDQLQRLMDILKPYTQNIKEYSIEMNPETVDFKKLQILKKGGITRLSLGVQTFQEQLLPLISRYHDNKNVEDVICQARTLGFDNVSIDLMYGIPQQSFADIQKDLSCVKTLDIDHISYYSLILEEHTVLSNIQYQPLDEQEEGYYYDYIEKELNKMGFEKYEVSNFARAGKRSLHNQVYWHYDDYIGVGLGAHGKVQGVRYQNTRSLTAYLKGQYLESKEVLEKADQMFEMVMMGLRLTDGVSLQKFRERFNEDLVSIYQEAIHKYVKMHLLEIKEGCLTTTKQGMNYLNEILIDFL